MSVLSLFNIKKDKKHEKIKNSEQTAEKVSRDENGKKVRDEKETPKQV